MVDTDLELAQLLCTRLCHDLAGPVGAIAAGVELIGGDPSQVDAETLSLIGNSSSAAAQKLKFMRTAMGSSAGASGDPKVLVEGYLEAVSGLGGKPVVEWPSADRLQAGSRVLGPGWLQILLNLFLLGHESQPSCRTLALRVMNSSGLTVVIEAHGAPDRVAVLRDDILAAVAGRSPPALSAKTVHGHLAGRMVRAAGGTLALSAAADGISVTATFPPPAGALPSGPSLS